MADEFPADVMDEILDLLQRGDKLKAIKRYMDERDVGLIEAKAFIEELTLKANNSQGVAEAKSDIADLIYDGQKIAAVKRYRKQHGTSLKDAKLAIEQLTIRLREQYPERFTASKAGGCAAVVMFFAALVVSSAANVLYRIVLN
jgi:ribosomal protein L7/L12